MAPGPSDADELTNAVQLQLERERRLEHRRQWAQDMVTVGALGAVVVVVGWSMWRLDDRSERLFALVESSRPVATACP